jgi:hypothetical protein
MRMPIRLCQQLGVSLGHFHQQKDQEQNLLSILKLLQAHSRGEGQEVGAKSVHYHDWVVMLAITTFKSCLGSLSAF